MTRAVREGIDLSLRRPADARPLRQRARQHRVASRRRSRRRCSTRSGIALAAKIRKHRPGRHDLMGEGSSNQGDVHEGLNFAAIHKLPFILVRREQRLRDQRAGGAGSSPFTDVAARASGYGIPGVIVDGADVLALLPGREGSGRSRAARRRPDAHRGQGHPPHRALLGRPADEVPLRGGARRAERERPAAALPGAAQGRRRPDRRARGDDRGRGRRPSRRRHGLRRERRRAAPDHGDEVGVRRGLAGRDAAGVGLRRIAVEATKATVRRRGRSTDGAQDVHRGDPRDDGRGDAPRRRRSSCWARTSA